MLEPSLSLKFEHGLAITHLEASLQSAYFNSEFLRKGVEPQMDVTLVSQDHPTHQSLRLRQKAQECWVHGSATGLNPDSDFFVRG